MKTTKFTRMCISPYSRHTGTSGIWHQYFTFTSVHMLLHVVMRISPNVCCWAEFFVPPIGKLQWLSPSFQLPIIISSNPSSILTILGMMISSPLGIDSSLLSISPCNSQAHKSKHPYLLNQVFRSNVLDLFFPHKLYHYLTDYISRNKDCHWCDQIQKDQIDPAVMTQWYITLSGTMGPQKKFLGSNHSFFSLAIYHQISNNPDYHYKGKRAGFPF